MSSLKRVANLWVTTDFLNSPIWADNNNKKTEPGYNYKRKNIFNKYRGKIQVQL